MDSGFVLSRKWRSHISFLWNVKQAKKRLEGILIQSSNLCVFPLELWCSKFPVISLVKLLFWSMPFEGDRRSVKVFQVEFLTLKHLNQENVSEVLYEKVSLPKFLITIACHSLMLIFFNIILAIKHTATYFAVW